MSRRVVVAAIIAVALWSLKPVWVTFIGDRGGYAEVFLVSGAMACVASIAGLWATRRRGAAVLGGIGRPGIRRALFNAAVSGVLLGAWYYGFYRALYTSRAVDATVISFSWPLIAAATMPLLVAGAARLGGRQWLLIGVSFLGAAAVAASSGGEWGSWDPSIIWAFVAAAGSGLYLPFAIRALRALGGSDRTYATFLVTSAANVVAVVTVSAWVWASGGAVDFSRFTIVDVAICAVIGIGTYIVAEVAWTWAMQAGPPTLAVLPYFSPAVSVILLAVLFGERVTVIAVAGLVAILVANLVLLRSKARAAPTVNRNTTHPLTPPASRTDSHRHE